MMFDMSDPKPSDAFRLGATSGRAGAGLPRRCERYARAPLHDARVARSGSPRTADDADGWDEVAAAHRRRRRRARRACSRSTARRSSSHRRGARIADGALPEADIIVSDDPGVGAGGSEPPTACRCSSPIARPARWRPRTPAGAAWPRACPASPSSAWPRTSAAAPADLRRRRSDRRSARAATKSGADVRDAFDGAAFAPAQLERWFQRPPLASAGNPPMPRCRRSPRPATGSSTAGQSARDQLTSAGVSGASDLRRRSSARRAIRDVFCSYRRDGAPPAGWRRRSGRRSG